ncbi:MAG: rhomboid family intramembrane serine protease [Planctomycetota bacterium]
MRLIGTLGDSKQSENFKAFLMTQGIRTHIEKEGDEFEVWVKDEDRVKEANSALESFRANPEDAKYTEAVGIALKLQDEEIRKRRQIAKNVVPVSGGKVPKSYPVTIFLIGICGMVALLTNFGEDRTKATFRALSFNAIGDPERTELLLEHNDNLENVNVRMASVLGGEFWRLVTPIFIHFGPFHIVFNMYWLFVLGGQIENRYGAMRYAILILVAAVFSNLLQATVPYDVGGSPPVNTTAYLVNMFGGMSGVNYALFGFILMKMTYDRSSRLYLSQSTVFLLLGWLIFCLTPVYGELFPGERVANWAHVIGMLVGVIAGYVPTLFER